MSAEQEREFERDAAELDAVAHVPDDVLSGLVARDGLCLWEITRGDPPMWTGDGSPDRESAARLCAGCPVRRECLEFELRTTGADTVGVWGGLSEDDRRALHAVWRARAGRSTDGEIGTDSTGTDSTGTDSTGTDDQDGGQATWAGSI